MDSVPWVCLEGGVAARVSPAVKTAGMAAATAMPTPVARISRRDAPTASGGSVLVMLSSRLGVSGERRPSSVGLGRQVLAVECDHCAVPAFGVRHFLHVELEIDGTDDAVP